MLLDKTGTITKGKPELTEVVRLPGQQTDEVLRLAAEAEQGSEHPLAAAIVEGAKVRGLTLSAHPERFAALAGRGLEATVKGHAVLIGTRHLFTERALPFDALQQQVEALEQQGKTTMLVAIDGEAAGVLAVADTVKVGSTEAVKQLHAQGIEVWMITGDNRRTAQAIALQVGIPAEHVLAEVLPEEKAIQVKRLQEQGLVVAFAGDGINDAPALVQADAGYRHGHRNGDRDGGCRHYAGQGEPEERGDGALAFSRHAAHHQAESVLGVRLQRDLDPRRDSVAADPVFEGAGAHLCSSGHGLLLRHRRQQLVTVAPLWTITATRGANVIPSLASVSWINERGTRMQKLKGTRHPATVTWGHILSLSTYTVGLLIVIIGGALLLHSSSSITKRASIFPGTRTMPETVAMNGADLWDADTTTTAPSFDFSPPGCKSQN